MATSLRFCTALTVVALAACGGRRGVVGPAPASPEATVGQFLAAVNANDHRRMAELFGDEHGPSSVTWSNASRRDSVITIMQHLLLTDSVRILGTEPLPGKGTWRVLRMDLFHGEQRAVVPFTVAPQAAGGWLVALIDILPLMPSVNAPARSRP